MSQNTADGSLGRVLAQVTVRTHQRIRAADRAKAEFGGKELDQQFQVQISGTAGTTPAFAEVTLKFDYALFAAPGNRESTLRFPHFTFGSATNPAVFIHATVTEWLEDEKNGSIIGAVVSIGAFGNGESFTGVAHLTFQGYGSLIEEEEAEGPTEHEDPAEEE